MTEDLIEVEGNLRVPTLHALTDSPLNYGREWSPAFSRPVQSRSEFALFAAQFRTAYVPALSLSDTNSPYRAASLWGVFAKEHIPRAMLRLMEGKSPSDEAGIDRAAFVHLNVSAPAAPGAAKHYFSKPVAALTAVACAALIAWLFFEYDRDAPGKSRAAPAMEVGTQSREPDAKAQPDRPVSPAAASIAAVETGVADRPAKDSQTSQAATPSESAIAIANANVIASENVPAATRREASGVHLIPETTARRPNGRVRTVLAPRTPQTAAVRTPATDKHVAKRDTTAHARAPSARAHADRASKVSDPMNAEALYAILQHSPTLDSNAGGASSRGGAQTQNAR